MNKETSFDNNDDLYSYDHRTHPNAFTEYRCEDCGAELRRFEYERYETQCHSCVKHDTMNLVEDNPYEELE